MVLTNTPDGQALILTIGHAAQIIEHGQPGDWIALTQALIETHTPEQLANMLTGAAAIIARTGAKA